MAQWYIKELSKLTQVSVRTLHHYDEIGLLKPSVRQPNGYRLYSEKDLLNLELIQALKFFGFSLSQIANLMEKNSDLLSHLYAQKNILQAQLGQLSEADLILDSVIRNLEQGSILFEDIVKLIEGYRMPNVTYYEPNSDIQKQYEEELIKEGSLTRDQISQGQDRLKHLGQEGWDKLRKEGELVNQELALAMQNQLDSTSVAVQELIRKHYKWICNFWIPNKEAYIALGRKYVEHPGFKSILIIITRTCRRSCLME